MGRLEDQFFSVVEGRLHYMDKPITDEVIDDARNLLSSHVIPRRNSRALYESLWLCIASQNESFEQPCKFIRSMKEATMDQLTNYDYLNWKARAASVLFADRWSESITWIGKYSGGIEQLAQDYLHNPIEIRKRMEKEVLWIGMKTASFWYLCMGGTELMTLDRHNFKQIKGIGVEMKEGYYIPQLRKNNGRKVIVGASKTDYTRIENEILELLKDEPKVHDDGKINAAFVTAIFWKTGAQFARGRHPNQLDLYDKVVPLGFDSPYSRKDD